MHLNYKETGLLIKAVAYWLARHVKEGKEREDMRELLEKLYNLGAN